jgi:hypothetical protein
MIAGLSRRFPDRIPTPTSAEATSWMWFGLASVYIVALSLSMSRISYDIWGALVIGPVLAALTLPVLRRAVARDDPTMVNLITLAFVVKMLGAVARYAVTFGIYDESADAVGYHGAGARLAQGFWQGDFARVFAEEVPDLVGTEFIRLTTGVLYIVTGPTMLAGFLVYSLLSFWGLYFFYRALRTAFPEADHRRYALFLFFLPSLLYWPSSIGKEAWIMCMLGLTTYGVALIMKHQLVGYPYTGFGLLGVGMVRPHITALCFVALFVAYLLRRRSWRDSTFGPLGKLVGIGFLLVVGGVVLGAAASFFNLQGVDRDSVDQVLTYTENQSTQGGSEFEGSRAFTPAEFPNALLTVLFRPWPWEASNGQMLVAAAEGVVLGVAFLGSWRRLVRIPGFIFRVPYLAYCLSFIVMFVFAFSSIGNFGILTRQRTQMFPFVLVLLALPRHRIDDGDDLRDDRQIQVKVPV